MAKLLSYGGQIIDPTTYIYIYIHTYAVGSIAWPPFLNLYNSFF